MTNRKCKNILINTFKINTLKVKEKGIRFKTEKSIYVTFNTLIIVLMYLLYIIIGAY